MREAGEVVRAVKPNTENNVERSHYGYTHVCEFAQLRGTESFMIIFKAN